MGLLQDGQAWLNEQMGQAAGVAIEYSRGPDSVSITAESGKAWIGRTPFSSLREGGGPRVEWGDRDYLIVADALTGQAWFGEPKEGDTIKETVGGVQKTFRLLRPDTGEPAWRWSDAGRTRYRLHVKEFAG